VCMATTDTPRPGRRQSVAGGGGSHRDRIGTLTAPVLPMQLRIGDRLTDETGEYELIGRPHTTAGGKSASVRVKRVGSGPR
jgi:hypothetical protein